MDCVAAHGTPGADGLTGIVAAMPDELAPLVRRTCVTARLDLPGCTVHRGRLSATEVVLAVTGEGRRSAEEGVEQLLGRFPIERIIVVGTAGGLSPALQAGSLVVAREVRGTHGDVARFQGSWLDRALAVPGVVGATVLTAERILGTASAKAQAGGALNGPAVVDLESAAYVAAARARGVPSLVVRAVCDPVDEDLPLDFDGCRDSAGRLRRSRVVGRALLAPTSIPGLLKLRRRVADCSDRLAGFILTLLEHEHRAHEAGKAS